MGIRWEWGMVPRRCYNIFIGFTLFVSWFREFG
jgi:hypothetical protein